MHIQIMEKKLMLKEGRVKSIAVIAILGILFQSCILAPSAKKQYSKALQTAPYDAIIVPGMPFENGTWPDLLKKRMYCAA